MSGENDFFYLRPLQIIDSSSGQRYANISFVGRGGSGTTFRVLCVSGLNTGFEFATKVFHRVSDADRRKRFLEEAKVLASLQHPGIVKAIDSGVFQTYKALYPFMVVEFLPRSLRDEMNAGGLKRFRALKAGLQLLGALDYVHTLSTPIVHRDVKPENILIAGDQVKLADFGLIRYVVDSDIKPTTPGTVGPAMPYYYRTPELIEHAKGGEPPSTASDVFQAATVLYECITGYNPQKRPANVLDPIELDIRDIRGVGGEELTQLVKDMTGQDPGGRPTAAQARHRLLQVYTELQKSHVEMVGETA